MNDSEARVKEGAGGNLTKAPKRVSPEFDPHLLLQRHEAKVRPCKGPADPLQPRGGGKEGRGRGDGLEVMGVEEGARASGSHLLAHASPHTLPPPPPPSFAPPTCAHYRQWKPMAGDWRRLGRRETGIPSLQARLSSSQAWLCQFVPTLEEAAAAGGTGQLGGQQGGQQGEGGAAWRCWPKGLGALPLRGVAPGQTLQSGQARQEYMLYGAIDNS